MRELLNNNDYYMDLVVCLECGNDMLVYSKEISGIVRHLIHSFAERHEESVLEMERLHTRVRFVAFGGDRYDSITECDFFDPLSEWGRVEKFLSDLRYSGLPGNPAVALCRAIESDWVSVDTTRRRQVILMLGRGDAAGVIAVQGEIDSELDGLQPVWEGTEPCASPSFSNRRARMVILSDGCYPWHRLCEWCHVFYANEPVRQSDELADAIAELLLH